MVRKLNEIKLRAWAYTWMHRENSQYLKRQYDRISYLNIFLELLTATSIFVTANVCQDTYYVKVLTGIVAIVSGFISGLLKYQDYGQEISKHKHVTSRYSRIYDAIDRQLDTPLEAQEQFHHFHNSISHEYDSLFGTAPDLDEEVIQKYIRKFGETRKVHPLEAAEYEKPKTDSSSGENTPEKHKTPKEEEQIEPIKRSKKSRRHKEEESQKINSDSESELKEYVTNYRKKTKHTEAFNPGLYNYQMDRMRFNTDKCFIDPLTLARGIFPESLSGDQILPV